MANYKNSLGESELFGRMTAGFAKICESVQSGKFVRDEMGVICESVCEDDENAGAAPEGETADAGSEGATADAGTEGATQDADVASATPEQINGSVTEGIVGKTLGTIGGATVGSAIGGALGCPVAGGIAGGIAGASLTEGCDGKNKKPMKKLIPEGCCGGKAKKVLKECGSTVVTEKKVPLCKTCGNPLDETGTCQDCQGYSPVKEGEGEIKLQIPAELKRKAALKANAQANKEKVAQAIRDGKAVGIVKEDEEKKKVTVKYCFEVSDPDKEIINLLTYVGKIAGGGHSFDITVDAGSKDYEKTFFIDGDGADRINKIEIIEVDEDGNETVRKAKTEEEDKED